MTLPKHAWEDIEVDTSRHAYTQRCRVPGGWLYRYREYRFDDETQTEHYCGGALVYVPDPDA
jgi:hypothetical protein